MGKVTTLLKVMPKHDTTDLDELLEKIESNVNVEDADREPVAFGLEALKILVRVSDEEGGTEEVENTVSEIEDVNTVEVESVNRE
jgi:translation elongation factor aEF-1 beta